MTENRGFNFLAGLATIWLSWRLHQAGILHDIGFLMSGEPTVSGPGAVVVSFLIEAVITIGWVVTLILSGLWDLLCSVGVLARDSLQTGNEYLANLKAERFADGDSNAPIDHDAAASSLTTQQAFLATLADTREQVSALTASVAKMQAPVPTPRKRAAK